MIQFSSHREAPWLGYNTDFKCPLCHARVDFINRVDRMCPTCGDLLPNVMNIYYDLQEARVNYYKEGRTNHGRIFYC